MARISNPIITVLTITLVIYISVDVFYRVVRAGLGSDYDSEIIVPERIDIRPVASASMDDFQVVIDRNIFGAIEKPSRETLKTEVEALEPTKLRISLMGTVAGNKDNAAAVISESGKGTQGIYRIGDSIQNAVVKDILRGRVVLNMGGREEVLIMQEPSSPESLSSRTMEKPENASVPPETGMNITIRQEDFEESFENINDLMAEAQMRPHLKDGKLEGFTLIGINAGSIFRKMGLRNGDVILAIGDNPVSDPAEVLAMYNEIRSGSDFSLLIDRRGQQRSINYNIR